MPAERLSMRQIREVLRLRFASKLRQRAIAKSLGLSQGAVSTYLSQARAASVAWPLHEDLDDAQLELRSSFPRNAGIKLFQSFMDSGSPLRCGRNDGFCSQGTFFRSLLAAPSSSRTWQTR